MRQTDLAVGSYIHDAEDAQIYYVKLEETPDLLRFLAEAGITSREACGNTVRNITRAIARARLPWKHSM